MNGPVSASTRSLNDHTTHAHARRNANGRCRYSHVSLRIDLSAHMVHAYARTGFLRNTQHGRSIELQMCVLRTCHTRFAKPSHLEPPRLASSTAAHRSIIASAPPFFTSLLRLTAATHHTIPVYRLPGEASLFCHQHRSSFVMLCLAVTPRCYSTRIRPFSYLVVPRARRLASPHRLLCLAPLVSPPSCLARCLTSSRCCLTSSLLAPRYLTSHPGPPYRTARAACRRSPASSIVQHANELSPPSIASCHLSGETWQRGCLLIVLKGFCTTLADPIF